MRSVLVTILVLAAIAVGLWLLVGFGGNEAQFSVRELKNKVVYDLVDGQVDDLIRDCAVRGGEFNRCGSMCETGEICATVCAFTCEFAPSEPVDDSDAIDSDDLEQPDSDSDAVLDDIECGVRDDGTTVQCPLETTCFTHEGSSPTCAVNPCEVCSEGQECLQLESYPAQIRCVEPEEEAGPEEDDAVSEEPVSSAPPEPVETPVASENIKVTSPTLNQAVTSPITVAGQARVFENVVNIRITNQAGSALIEEIANAHAPDIGQFGPFSIKVNYSFSATKEGFIEVYSESARDGSVENLVRIPVKFN